MTALTSEQWTQISKNFYNAIWPMVLEWEASNRLPDPFQTQVYFDDFPPRIVFNVKVVVTNQVRALAETSEGQFAKNLTDNELSQAAEWVANCADCLGQYSHLIKAKRKYKTEGHVEYELRPKDYQAFLAICADLIVTK